MSLLHCLLPEAVPFTKVDCSLQSCVADVQPLYHRCRGWGDRDCPPVAAVLPWASPESGWWRQSRSWAGRMGQVNPPELGAVRVKGTVPVPSLCSWGQGCTLGGAAGVCLSLLLQLAPSSGALAKGIGVCVGSGCSCLLPARSELLGLLGCSGAGFGSLASC